MKLKPLKDIQKPIRNDEGNCVRVEELRAEAVNWIKEFPQELTPYLHESTVAWIKHFFNLTEEELK